MLALRSVLLSCVRLVDCGLWVHIFSFALGATLIMGVGGRVWGLVLVYVVGVFVDLICWFWIW